MASRIVEFFGYDPLDQSAAAVADRTNKRCPFINDTCQKLLKNDDTGAVVISGVCTLKQATSGPVICCPYRLYADGYKVLTDVADAAFGGTNVLIPGHRARAETVQPHETKVAVFGKRWGKELRLPNRGRVGGYFVDWVLAKLNTAGQLQEFVAVEVQSIDTTGNYRAERDAYLRGIPVTRNSTAGFNWENVNKRILPQLIYKGHVLRRERLCTHGLFFICPKQVYDKIRERLGGNLYEYQPQAGSMTFMWYDIGAEVPAGQHRALQLKGRFTTTVDQVATAFTAPTNLPDANVYEAAIRAEL